MDIFNEIKNNLFFYTTSTTVAIILLYILIYTYLSILRKYRDDKLVYLHSIVSDKRNELANVIYKINSLKKNLDNVRNTALQNDKSNELNHILANLNKLSEDIKHEIESEYELRYYNDYSIIGRVDYTLKEYKAYYIEMESRVSNFLLNVPQS